MVDWGGGEVLEIAFPNSFSPVLVTKKTKKNIIIIIIIITNQPKSKQHALWFPSLISQMSLSPCIRMDPFACPISPTVH